MKEGGKGSRLEEFIANPRGALWRLALPAMIGMVVTAAIAGLCSCVRLQ